MCCIVQRHLISLTQLNFCVFFLHCERERCIHKSLISLPSSLRTHSLSLWLLCKHTQVRSILISLPTAPFFFFFSGELSPFYRAEYETEIRVLFLKVSWTKNEEPPSGALLGGRPRLCSIKNTLSTLMAAIFRSWLILHLCEVFYVSFFHEHIKCI